MIQITLEFIVCNWRNALDRVPGQDGQETEGRQVQQAINIKNVDRILERFSMCKFAFMAFAAVLILAGSGLASDVVPHAGSLNRITPTDDGTIQLRNLGNDMVLFSDIDDQGSRLGESDYAYHETNRSIGYLFFDLGNLTPVSDQNLVMLKFYADNATEINSDLIITTGRVLSIQDGLSSSGLISFADDDRDVTTGSGFALFNLTEVIRTMQQQNQTSMGIFFAGDGVTMGTLESGRPAEIIVL